MDLKKLVFYSLLFVLLAVPCYAAKDSVEVAYGYDDCEENQPGNFDSTQAWYYFASQLYAGFTSAVRFTGLSIAQGTQIDSAFLHVTPYIKCQFTAGDTCKIVMYCEDADASAIFDSNDKPGGRTKTDSSYVFWTQEQMGVESEGPRRYDVTDPVQEVLNRPSWGGDVITFLFEDNGSYKAGKISPYMKWWTFEVVGEYIPSLVIWYPDAPGEPKYLKLRK